MNNQVTLLTPEGYKKLQEELIHYKSVRRMEVAERLNIAISYGDISENAEYDAAKDEQAFIEGHIAELEHKLNTAKIIEGSEDKDVVSIGSTVVLFDKTFDEELEFHIVGSTEADPFENRISNESPVGSAILGKKVGDIATVVTPDGEEEYKILAIN